AAQDGGRPQAEVDPDDSRRRLRAARAMSFRTRLALVAAAAVALAVVVASFVVWFVVRDELYGQLDKALGTEAAAISRGPLHVEQAPFGPDLDVGRPSFELSSYVQAVRSDGKTVRPFG